LLRTLHMFLGVLAVGDRVENLALGHLAEAVVVVGGRGAHAVGFGDALPSPSAPWQGWQ
jgi:hypothetical protein